MFPRDSDLWLNFGTTDPGYICIYLRLLFFLSSTFFHSYGGLETVRKASDHLWNYCDFTGDHCLCWRFDWRLTTSSPNAGTTISTPVPPQPQMILQVGLLDFLRHRCYLPFLHRAEINVWIPSLCPLRLVISWSLLRFLELNSAPSCSVLVHNYG